MMVKDLYKPHIRKTGIDAAPWRCEYMRKSDDIVQSGYGHSPKQAYEICMNDKDSCVQGNALLHRILNNASR